jgi:putative hydrolases of HD superfamily
MQQIVDFVLEIDRLKAVTRKIRPRGLDRYENSAEHSWQIALLATSLAGYAAAPVSIDHVIRMLLVHDLGEIDTGDTIFFAAEGLAQRKAGELAAVTRIFGLLPPAQGDAMMALWQEFETGETAEARFAHAADRAMPVLLNLNNNGQSWRENNISYARVVGPPIASGCPALWSYIKLQLDDAQARGWFGIALPNAS